MSRSVLVLHALGLPIRRQNDHAVSINKTDSPSIAFVKTFAEHICEVTTMLGVTQSKNHIVTDIVLSGDYYVGQHLDDEDRHVIRLSRTMFEGEAHRICHRDYNTCIECGSDTTPDPDDIIDLLRQHERKVKRMQEQFDAKVEAHRAQALERADHYLSVTDEATECLKSRNEQDSIPIGHIRCDAELLREPDVTIYQVVQHVHSLQHWLHIADQVQSRNREIQDTSELADPTPSGNK